MSLASMNNLERAIKRPPSRVSARKGHLGLMGVITETAIKKVAAGELPVAVVLSRSKDETTPPLTEQVYAEIEAVRNTVVTFDLTVPNRRFSYTQNTVERTDLFPLGAGFLAGTPIVVAERHVTDMIPKKAPEGVESEQESYYPFQSDIFVADMSQGDEVLKAANLTPWTITNLNLAGAVGLFG